MPSQQNGCFSVLLFTSRRRQPTLGANFKGTKDESKGSAGKVISICICLSEKLKTFIKDSLVSNLIGKLRKAPIFMIFYAFYVVTTNLMCYIGILFNSPYKLISLLAIWRAENPHIQHIIIHKTLSFILQLCFSSACLGKLF